MRMFICLALILVVSPETSPQSATQVGSGPQAAVEIKILEEISSQTLHPGQSIAFEVDHDVTYGTTSISAGTRVTGEVTQVKAAGAWEKSGSLDLVLRPVHLANGSTIKLDFYRPKKLSGKKEKAAVGIVAPFVLFYYWPLVPIAAVQESRTHGQPAIVHAGERFLVYGSSPEPAPVASPPATAPAANSQPAAGTIPRSAASPEQ